MHIETSGLSRRRKKKKKTPLKGEESEGEKEKACVLFSAGLGETLQTRTVGSDPPEQQVVGAVVPPDCLAAIGQSEVLVAVAPRDD